MARMGPAIPLVIPPSSFSGGDSGGSGNFGVTIPAPGGRGGGGAGGFSYTPSTAETLLVISKQLEIITTILRQNKTGRTLRRRRS